MAKKTCSGFASLAGARLDLVLAPLRPFQRAPRRRRGTIVRRRILDALIEHHADIGSQRALHLNGFFGREHVFGAVEMRPKPNPFLAHLAQIRQAEHLVPAGVRQDAARPGHEPVQPAHAPNQLVPRPQIEVIGVRQQQPDLHLLERLLRHGLYGPGRSHGHERRRLDGSVRRGQAPQACARRVHLHDFKAKWHTWSLAALRPARRSHISAPGSPRRSASWSTEAQFDVCPPPCRSW